MAARDEARSLVLVTTRSFGSGDADPERLLARAGLRVERGHPGHDPTDLAPRLSHAAAWIAGTGPIGPEHLELAPDLRVIARYGTGVDAVDLDACSQRGVVVTNTPGANAESVADHALALLLAALRRLVDADRDLRAGEADRYVGRELASLTVGIVGLGNVGRAVARRLTALGAEVVAYDPEVGPDAAARLGVTWRGLDDLVGTCDVVSLHCPGGGPPVLDRDRLASLPAGAVVVNAARHDVVDEVALAQLLHDGHLGAAALDVVEDPQSPLYAAPRTVLTPHIAGHTVQAIDRMGIMAAEEVIRVLVHGEPPQHPVAT